VGAFVMPNPCWDNSAPPPQIQCRRSPLISWRKNSRESVRRVQRRGREEGLSPPPRSKRGDWMAPIGTFGRGLDCHGVFGQWALLK